MGLGFYDNETECYVFDEDVEEGEWYVSEDGTLYIVPRDGDEILGPDDDTSAALAKVWREAARMRSMAAAAFITESVERLGLTEVSPILRRFSPEDGYFTE